MVESDPAQPTPETGSTQSARLSVIGIGASAGGLTSLNGLFDALPADTDMVFVVIVHLSPERESMMAELLQRHTVMPVIQVHERVEMESNHVYVVPPGKRLVVTGSHLDLVEFEMPWERRLQIDTFFRSLAEHHGDGAAIVLSGSGSDGAVGIQSIKEKGGLILVQSPDEAEFDDMPRNAIATGLIDVVAPVTELAARLVAAKRGRVRLELPQDPNDLSVAAQQTLSQILAQLRMRSGHDFTGYKAGTILRRIGRRMQLGQFRTLSDYLEYLRQDPAEIDTLYRDLLIHVTEFFRDPDAWKALTETIVPKLFEGKGPDDSVRVWTVGCASGEEAYGLAILLLEYASTLDNPPEIQIFGSDLGSVALDFAREGRYPAAIAANVSEERLARFFDEENNHYRVRPEVRELVLFTPHNLLQDPPFSRQDLILCRNLLIYLRREVQERVFNTFYYALQPDGYLFLGSSESAEGVTDLFETVQKRHRIYRRSQQSQDRLVLPGLAALRSEIAGTQTQKTPERIEPEAEQHRSLLEERGLPSLLVDEMYNVLHFSETAGRYLQHPGGTPTNDLVRLVRPELQTELRLALRHAFAQQKVARSRPVQVHFNGVSQPVTVLVWPSPDRDRGLVIFLDEEDDVPVAERATEGPLTSAQEGRVEQLEAELRHVRQRLQTTREDYETTVEELRIANEELQSTNEEYHSTLEELETSKEEMQSVNEELHTVNQELKDKMEEISQAHADLQNLFGATEIATLFLDRELHINRFTPRAADLFNLLSTDRGRPIEHLRSNLAYEEMEEDARTVLEDLVPIQREAQGDDGNWFLVTLRPYRTLDNHVDGVVITFVDVTANKEVELALRDAKEYAESIVHTMPSSVLVLQTDLRVKSANETFYETFQVSPEETEGRLIYELGNGQWDIPKLHTLLEDVLPERKVFTDHEVDHRFEHIGHRVMLVNGRQLDHVQFVLLAITDITEREQTAQALSAELSSIRRLHELGTQLLLEDNIDRLLDEIMDAAIEITAADMGSMQMLVQATDELLLRGQRGFDQPFLDFYERIDAGSDYWFADALETGERIVVQDITSSEFFAGKRALDVKMAAGVRALQCTPLVTRSGITLGLLSTHWRQPHEPTERDLRMLDLLARQAADLIERAQAEAALREAQESLELALEAAQVGTWNLDLTTGTTERSLRHDQIFGYDELQPEWNQEIARSHVLPKDRPKFDEGYARALEQGELHLEVRVRWPDNSVHWIYALGSTYYDEEGEPERLVGVIRDITERMEAERAEIRQRLIQGQEADRAHMAREIHDGPLQEMAALTFELAAHANSLTDEAQQAHVAVIAAKLERIIGRVRNTMVTMRPPAVVDFGLIQAITDYVGQFRDRHPEQTVDVTLPEEPLTLSEDVILTFYRVVQQALYNVTEHAMADHIWVRLHVENAHLILEIEDDGVGFTMPAHPVQLARQRYLGIVGMMERAEQIGGHLQVKTEPGQGTLVRLSLPFPDA